MCVYFFEESGNYPELQKTIRSTKTTRKNQNKPEHTFIMPSHVKCYDCQAFVTNLRFHRQSCPNRRFRGHRGHRGHHHNHHKHHHPINPTKSTKMHYRDPAGKRKIVGGKDVFFVLDVSGSMAGSRLIQAKEVIQEVFDELDAVDRASLVAFDTSPFMKLYPRSVNQLRRQKEIPPLLGRIWANGLTALWDAVDLTLANVYDKSRPTKIVVISDGQDNSSKKSREEVEAEFKEYPNIQLCFIQVGQVVQENRVFSDHVGGTTMTCQDIQSVKHQICEFVRVK